MKAMVFAAGLGTRLRPLTESMPKALVPVCGKPLLWHVLMKLRLAGVDESVVNVHHFADMVEGYIAGCGIDGMKISVSDERDMLRETGGGIRHAENLLGKGCFLVHNADILSDADIAGFYSKVRPDALATLLVSRRETSRYLLFDDSMRLAGWTDISTGQVRSPFPGLNPEKCRMLAFSGIHAISDSIFPLFGSEGFGERFSIMDFYLQVADRYPVYGVESENLHITDVGKAESLPEAEDFMKKYNIV